jgi:hypothetical protein
LPGGGVGVGIDESAQFGIIIAGLEVIVTGLCSDTLAIRVKLGRDRGLIPLSKTTQCHK